MLRLLILKHVRDRSYEVLEREVRANLVYRKFAGVGPEKVSDARTLGRLGQVVAPDVVGDLHRRMVEIAMEKNFTNRRVSGYYGLGGEGGAGGLLSAYAASADERGRASGAAARTRRSVGAGDS